MFMREREFSIDCMAVIMPIGTEKSSLASAGSSIAGQYGSGKWKRYHTQ
jgi:hypothetical protein